jgi:trimeric autotransporter adhesin
MSTKTLRKHIALVAVSALGFGLLSATAANADAIAAGEIVNTTAAAGVNTTRLCNAGTPTAAGTPATIAVGGTYQFTLSAANGDTGYAVVSGPADWSATAPSAGMTFDSTLTALTITDGDANSVPVLSIKGTGAVQVVWYSALGGTVLETYYLTAIASCTAGVSVANSHVQVSDSAANIDTAAEWIARQTNTATDAAAFLATSDQTATSLDNSNDVRTLFANDASAYIAIEANDAYRTAIGGSTNLLVISCDNNARVAGTRFNFYSAANFTGETHTAGAIQVQQPVSGVPATVTCTVSVNGVLLSTKVIKFAGDLASIEIAPSRIADVAAANSGRFTYEAKDAAGNRLTAALGTSDAHVLGTLVSNIALTTGAGGTTLGGFAEVTVDAASGLHGQSYGAGSNPYVSGKGTATFSCYSYGTKSVTVTTFNAAGVRITSNAATLTCEDKAIDTYTASLDKATYKQGDVATLTITAKGSGGNPTAYGTTPGTGFSVAMPGMTAVVAPSTVDTESAARTGTWVYTYTVNVGAEGAYNGAVRIIVGSTSPQFNKALTVPYTIGAGTAVSNADVLKAIVSLIASINKQIAALQKALLRR